jgi:hypothetical protein
MYLIAITLSLYVSYFALFFVFPFFFENRQAKIGLKSLVSVGLIFILSFLGYFIAFNIQDPELSNRFLHGFGGGFMALLVCFLVVKDSNLQIRKFQFIIFSLLVVAALGVVNEILEFFLQNYTGMVFSTSVNDTWLDLISNTVGMLIAVISFTPFVNIKK